MGRRASVNYCMLCDSTPCQCSAAPKPKKPTTKTVPKKKTLTAVAPVAAPAPVVQPRISSQNSEHDIVLHNAIRVLAHAGLLSGNDRDKYRHVLAAEPTPDERAAIWRARRRFQNAQE